MVLPAVASKGRHLSGPDLDDHELNFSLREVVELNLEEMTEILQELRQLQRRECLEAYTFQKLIHVLVVLSDASVILAVVSH